MWYLLVSCVPLCDGVEREGSGDVRYRLGQGCLAGETWMILAVVLSRAWFFFLPRALLDLGIRVMEMALACLREVSKSSQLPRGRPNSNDYNHSADSALVPPGVIFLGGMHGRFLRCADSRLSFLFTCFASCASVS